MNGTFVFNGFLAAEPADPTIVHLCNILSRNWAATNHHARSEYTDGGLRDAFACFSTETSLLNRVLNGCNQIVSFCLAAEPGIVNAEVNQRAYGLPISTEN